jgi:hypothetical protein
MIPFAIPSSFYLFGQKITVEWSDTLVDMEDKTGQSIYRRNIIQLQTSNGGIIRPSSQLESTFLHELLHFVFFMLGKDDMRADEALVDTIARLLHQAFTTAEYNCAFVKNQGGK